LTKCHFEVEHLRSAQEALHLDRDARTGLFRRHDSFRAEVNVEVALAPY
jgi:hypothetical protein